LLRARASQHDAQSHLRAPRPGAPRSEALQNGLMQPQLAAAAARLADLARGQRSASSPRAGVQGEEVPRNSGWEATRLRHNLALCAIRWTQVLRDMTMGTGVTPRPTMVDLMRKLRALLDALFICSSLRLSGTFIGIDVVDVCFPVVTPCGTRVYLSHLARRYQFK
jgi:hypothetical protein